MLKRTKGVRWAATVNEDSCIGCGACADICPVGAIRVEDCTAKVNSNECISCGACSGQCPVSAISL